MNSRYIESRRMKEVLGRHGFRFKKKYGQNFLNAPEAVEAIVEAADIGPDDVVLEIGPGMGTMTRMLSKRAGKVIAVEIDNNLIPVLEEELFGCNNVEILNNDILKMSLEEVFPEKFDANRRKIVANLPYYITTPILMKLLESGIEYSTITVMVQREVAERMTAQAKSKAYGALSLAVQYYTHPEINFSLDPGCFYPPPKVESTVITLKRYEEPPVTLKDRDLFFSIIRASFNQRRKKLINGLSNGFGHEISKEDIKKIFLSLGWDENIRGENLALEEFAMLEERIAEMDIYRKSI